MLPSCVGQDTRGVLVDQLDVRHERHPRMEALEEVVGEKSILRDIALERCDERVDVVKALAGKDAFVEEILIRIGNRRGVRIDARVSRVEPREQGAGRAEKRHTDAWLKDAVPLDNPPIARAEHRLIERMHADPDQLARDAPRQPRIAVERDAVLHLRQHGEIAHTDGETRIGRAAEQTVEFLDLSPFTLPSHPQPFALVPLAEAVKEEEPVGAAVPMLGIEL